MLTDDERATLQRWARRPKTAQALALRARIVLACADGGVNKEVAAPVRGHPADGRQVAGPVRGRPAGRVDDEPTARARPRTITDDAGRGGGRRRPWSRPRRRRHALVDPVDGRRTGLSQTAVSRIWRAFGLKPHLVDSFKLSTDPQFVDKVRDVVGLYLNPRAPRGTDDSSGGEKPSPPGLSQQER